MELTLEGGSFHPNPRASSCSSSIYRLRWGGGLACPRREDSGEGAGGEVDVDEEEDEEDGERGEREDRDPPVPLPPLLNLAPLLSNSQELDSGVGRTDDSTRYEESSEHDLLGDQTSACNTNTTNTPGSTRKFRAGPSPRSGGFKADVNLGEASSSVVRVVFYELEGERFDSQSHQATC